MTISDIITLAKNSELQTLSSDSNDEVILGFLNLGMIELYKRFPLSIEEYIIEVEDDVTEYKLPSDCMWIISSYIEVIKDSGKKTQVLPINEGNTQVGINTTKWDTIQISPELFGKHIHILYEASPSIYTIADLEINIDLPVQLIDTLLLYIGYRAHNALDASMDKDDNVYYQRFEANCKKVELMGMIPVNGMSMSTRITDRGFV